MKNCNFIRRLFNRRLRNDGIVKCTADEFCNLNEYSLSKLLMNINLLKDKSLNKRSIYNLFSSSTDL